MAVNEPNRHLPSKQRYGQNAICETLCESKLLLSEARCCFAGSRRSGTMAGLRQFGFYPKSRSLDFGEFSRLCRATLRRSGKQDADRNGKMPASFIFPIGNRPGESDERFGFVWYGCWMRWHSELSFGTMEAWLCARLALSLLLCSEDWLRRSPCASVMLKQGKRLGMALGLTGAVASPRQRRCKSRPWPNLFGNGRNAARFRCNQSSSKVGFAEAPPSRPCPSKGNGLTWHSTQSGLWLCARLALSLLLCSEDRLRLGKAQASLALRSACAIFASFLGQMQQRMSAVLEAPKARYRLAIGVFFFLQGFTFASWAAREPFQQIAGLRHAQKLSLGKSP